MSSMFGRWCRLAGAQRRESRHSGTAALGQYAASARMGIPCDLLYKKSRQSWIAGHGAGAASPG
jgi:hypothetical protein